MLRRVTSALDVGNKLATGYSLVVVTLMLWPLSAYGLALLVFLYLKRRRNRRLTTLGSARWAEDEDFNAAGMLGAASGLILGRRVAKRRFGQRDELVRLQQAVHTSAFSPTGGGKSTSLVIPFLLTSPESCVVLDFKGELATTTAEHRRRCFGHQIVLVDPYCTVTRTPDAFNPLDFIGADQPLSIDDCNDLASALVVRTGRETETHWNDSAEAVIAAVAATVAGYGERSDRSLQTVREIISQPRMLDLAIQLMIESDKWDGALRPMGGQLLQFAEKEKASVISSALRHLRFLGTPAIAASTRSSSFDPTQLRRGKMTVYLLLPPDRATAQTGLLRMWVSALLRTCVRGGMR